jgi:predicted ABC-type ATPase
MVSPCLHLLAGPNGSGKTTLAAERFAQERLEGRFLNVDDIAKEIRPDDLGRAAAAAGREILRRRAVLIADRRTFVQETTLASRTLLVTATRARNLGYAVRLTYLFVSDPDICVQRVAARVHRGGHYIEPTVVRRRYHRGLRLLPQFIEAADAVDIYLADALPRDIAAKGPEGFTVGQSVMWTQMVRLSPDLGRFWHESD